MVLVPVIVVWEFIKRGLKTETMSTTMTMTTNNLNVNDHHIHHFPLALASSLGLGLNQRSNSIGDVVGCTKCVTSGSLMETERGESSSTAIVKPFELIHS